MPTEGHPALAVHRRRRYVLYLAGVVGLTGIQFIGPALPALQRELGLTDPQIALVSSAYLLPSVPAAFLTGVLTLRLGRRHVLVASLVLFGVAGALVAIVPSDSLPLLLALRFFQGIGFAGLLPTTITVIGDLFSGTTQVRVQAHRSFAMQLADAALPVAGGFLALISWRLPFAAPVLAIPLAAAAWREFAGELHHTHPEVSTWSTVTSARDFMRHGRLRSLEYAGFMRFVVKFVVLTYLPILAVGTRGISASVAGLALGGAAVAGAVGAFGAARVARGAGYRLTLVLSFLAMATGMGMMGVGRTTMVLAAGATLWGLADGVYGVLLNAMVAVAVGGRQRATFVAFSGAIRNLGKFLAPVLVAAVTLMVPLSISFLLAGAVAFLGLLLVPALSTPPDGPVVPWSDTDT